MLSAFWLAGTAAAFAEAKRPNIIFILTDDQRLEDIEHMPILNRLMVVFVAFDHVEVALRQTGVRLHRRSQCCHTFSTPSTFPEATYARK